MKKINKTIIVFLFIGLMAAAVGVLYQLFLFVIGLYRGLDESSKIVPNPELPSSIPLMGSLPYRRERKHQRGAVVVSTSPRPAGWSFPRFLSSICIGSIPRVWIFNTCFS